MRDAVDPTRPSRRALLVGSLAAGSCLLVGFDGDGRVVAQTTSVAPGNPFQAYIKIDADDWVTIFSAHLEMGQGIHHGIATLVQEELSADWTKIRVENGWGDPDRFADVGLGGRFQSTGGSSGSIYSSWDRYRRVGALARAMIRTAAGAAWCVPEAELSLENGIVRHTSGREATYGLFAREAAVLPTPATVELKHPKSWRYIGNPDLRAADWRAPCPNLDAYTSDVAPAGLLTAVMIHPPRFGAKLAGFDASAARDVPGHVAVLRVTSGVAVVARGMWAALTARDKVSVRWNDDDADRTTTVDQMRDYRRQAKAGQGRVAVDDGNVDAALTGAVRVLEATYECPYLAHASMEPLNAVVRRNADRSLDVWTASQVPDFDVAAAAHVADVAPERIVLHVMKAGGSFGRRMELNSAMVIEAITVAKALNVEAPVKVQWTREDDMRGGRYRPAFVHHLRAGLDAQNRLVAWQSSLVGQSIIRKTPFAAMARDGVDPMSIETVGNIIYDIPNRRVDVTTPKMNVPVLWWRSVGATHGLFAVECFIDEIAEAAGVDPLTYRLGLLTGKPSLAAVLRVAAEQSDWYRPAAESRYRGVAIGRYFETCVAQVAEVSVTPDERVHVHRVVCAVDCGIAVNPDKIASQIEGAIGFGLGPVLGSRITLDDGVVQESNFDSYKVLRMDQMPKVEVHILPSDLPPRGIGEPSLPPIAPAVANAVYAATRRRRRSLPLCA